ncbi:MAG: cyclic nucleotide-binding domain-containing protein [Vampirovibrionia bacterium]
MRKSAYKAGKTIIKEGDGGSEAYIIVDGEVEVIKKTPDGSEIVLAKLGENQMFGEICLIDDTLLRSASVRCITDVVVAIIPKSTFVDKFQATPVSVKSILKVLAKRLSDTNDMFIQLYSTLHEMVRAEVGKIMDENIAIKADLAKKDELIAELEAEIEKLKVAGPPKSAKKSTSQSQKLDKDRSMKLSLKDLDNMAKQAQQDN